MRRRLEEALEAELSSNDELLLVPDRRGLRRNGSGQMVLELAKPPSLTAVARDCLVMSSASQDGPEARTALSTD